MILEVFNLNITKTAFTMNNIHHLYSLTIIRFCNVTDSILIQPLGFALEKTVNELIYPQEWFHRVHHHYKMKTNKQSITQIPVNNSLKTSSYMVSKQYF